ncbi:MAG: Type 1 glutamine amidotransferase-like domain-containing protein [Acidobacteriota bacterium]
MRSITLLGPQRLHPTLAPTMDRRQIDGTVVAITAGWQEREAEDDELRAHLDRPLVNLRLHRRCEEVFHDDPAFFRAHRARQDRLRGLQRLYRVRLDYVLAAARRMLRHAEGEPELLQLHRDSAIASARALDDEHLAQVRAVHEAFEDRWRPLRRDAVKRHREAIAEALADASALAIAGGHVAVLLNRMRMFAIADLAQDVPIFAWSAGAMALATRIVLFHDAPPQGAGNAEVLETGLGLYRGVVPLPHARHRLRLADAVRVQLFACRFAPDRCLTLDEHAAIHRASAAPGHDAAWQLDGASELGCDGSVHHHSIDGDIDAAGDDAAAHDRPTWPPAIHDDDAPQHRDDHLPNAVPEALVSAVPEALVSAVPEALVSAVPEALVSAVPEALVSAVPEALVSAVPEALVSAAPVSDPDDGL